MGNIGIYPTQIEDINFLRRQLRRERGGEAMKKRELEFWLWIAGRLPKRLISACLIKAIAFATSGECGNTIVPQMTAMEVLGRWEKEYKINGEVK